MITQDNPQKVHLLMDESLVLRWQTLQLSRGKRHEWQCTPLSQAQTSCPRVEAFWFDFWLAGVVRTNEICG